MSAFGGPNIITDGLVLSLDAGNVKSYPGSGTTWYDKSGNGNNGTLTNGPIFATGSIVFDGVDDYTEVSYGNNLNLVEYFTVSSWVYPTDLNRRAPIFSTRKLNPSGCWMLEVGNGNNGQNIAAFTGVDTWVYRSVNNSVSLNVWNNVVFVRGANNSSGTMFVNGILVNSQETTNYTIINNTDNRLIGQSNQPNTQGLNFKGNIVTVQVYNRALSASEVLQNYNATKTRFGL